MYVIKLKCFRGSMCLDVGEWSHASDDILKLADWMAELLRFDKNNVKEWGEHSNFTVLECTVQMFAKLDNDSGLLQQWAEHNFMESGTNYDGINGQILRKNPKKVKEYIRDQMTFFRDDAVEDLKRHKILGQQDLSFG